MTAETDHEGPRELIVVGVDGSAGSALALGFAVGEARLREARVVAVYAWQTPGGWDGGLLPVVLDPLASGEKCLRDAVAAVPAEDIDISRKVVQGHPVTVLLNAAAGADLLVVGSRRRGGFVGSLLGSVSHRCVAHATCPVVVVPTHCFDGHLTAADTGLVVRS